MTRKLKIDVVSDIGCPWCAIGVAGLDQALTTLADKVDADLTFHPFELNPDMPARGENGLEHVAHKYGRSPDEVRANRATIAERAAAGGFVMNVSDASRSANTFDAHRLIVWAADQGAGAAMERRLLAVYLTDQRDISDRAVLAEAAIAVRLDGAAASAMLASDAYVRQVRDGERRWRSRDIDSVPAVVVADRYLISGGQPPVEFERQLRGIIQSEAGRDGG